MEKNKSNQINQESWFVKHKMTVIVLCLFLVLLIFISKNKKSSTYEPTNKINNLSTTAIPTIVAGKVEVKSDKKKMDMDYTEIVGEVINKTGKPVESVHVIATFYDASGEVIATNDTFAGDTTDIPLEADKTTPFQVSSYPDKINADSYKLDISWR